MVRQHPDALKVRRNTLRGLRLEPDLVYPLLADGGDDWACVGELKHFRRLKHLNTTFSSIFGHPHERLEGNDIFDVLLERCETLRIRFDGVLETNMDEVFLSSLSVNTPLTSLEVYYHCGHMLMSSTLTHPQHLDAPSELLGCAAGVSKRRKSGFSIHDRF